MKPEDKKIGDLAEKLMLISPETWKKNLTSEGSEYSIKYNGKKITIYMNHTFSESFPVISISETSFVSADKIVEKKMRELYYKVMGYYHKIDTDKELKKRKLIIDEIEEELKPAYMNSIFTWGQIKKAFEKLFC